MNSYLLFTGFSSLVVLGTVLFCAVQMGRYLKTETVVANKWAFIFIMLYQLGVILIDWPGVISPDEIFLLDRLAQNLPSAWHSFSYSFLNSALIALTTQPFMVSLFDWFLFGLLLVILFSILPWSWKDLRYWGFLGILCLPPTSSMVYYQNRDSVYSLLLLIFLFGLLQTRSRRLPTLQMPLWILVLLGCILGDLRQEGKFITLLTPFLIWAFFPVTKKQTVATTFATIVLAIFIQFVPSQVFQQSSYSSDYKVTGILNPLSYIINHLGIEGLTEEQRENIDRVISLEKIIENPNPFDIDAFHRGGLRRPISDENFEKFERTALGLLLSHPLLYLENRWIQFKRMFVFDQVPFVSANFLREHSLEEFKEATTRFDISSLKEENSVQRGFYQSLRFYFDGLPYGIHLLIVSCLVPLLVLLYVTLNLKKNPWLGTLALVVLMRSFLILALTPAANFKYVLSTWVFGWLILFLLGLGDKQRPVRKTI